MKILSYPTYILSLYDCRDLLHFHLTTGVNQELDGGHTQLKISTKCSTAKVA